MKNPDSPNQKPDLKKVMTPDLKKVQKPQILGDIVKKDWAKSGDRQCH